MKKILVVDGELSDLDLYNTILTSAGFGVVTACDGKKVLEQYNKEKPDLVLMNVMAPGMNCYETVRLIRQESDSLHVPIIFISDALKDIEININALESGAYDFLVRPVEDKDLLRKVRSSLRMKNLYEELHATRTMLKKCESKYRTILETMQEGFFEVDSDGTMTFLNEAAIKMLGYPREKLIGKKFSILIAPDKLGLAEKKFLELQQSNAPSDLWENEITREDCCIRLLEISINRIKDNDSIPGGFRGIIRDITEKRKAEKDILMKSFAVEKSINAIAIMDINNNCTFANNSFLIMWGCDGKNEVLGKSILDFCHPDNRDDFMNVMEVLGEIGSWVGELALKKKDDSRFFVILSAAIIKNENDDAIGIIMSFVDITLRKKLDHSLKETKDVLAYRNRMMEKDLNIARTALSDIISKEAPRVKSVKVDFRYSPMETLGGDFFCFYPYLNDALGVFICDISGHGVASSLFLTLLKSITDRLSNKFGDSPADFITQLNKELVGNMSSFFITGIYGVFTRAGKSGEVLFSYANGAHPGPIVVRKSGQIKLHSAKSTLIGISSDISFKTNSITLGKEDRLFLYTDGIPETGNRQREMIGFEQGLLKLFKKSHQYNLTENLDSVISQVSEHRNGASITDDMLIIGFEAIC